MKKKEISMEVKRTNFIRLLTTSYTEYVDCPEGILTPDAKELREKLKKRWIRKKNKKS